MPPPAPIPRYERRTPSGRRAPNLITAPAPAALSLGWLGTGRMGAVMARRLLDAGHELTVWNRTRAKAEPLADAGARVVDRVADLAHADLVFVMVSTPADLEQVVIGADGLLSGAPKPRIIVDCSSVGPGSSARVRAAASELRGGVPGGAGQRKPARRRRR